MGKTFLFISYTDFRKKNITGAQKRLVELVNSVSINNNVIFLCDNIPEHCIKTSNLSHIKISSEKRGRIWRNHIMKIISLVRDLLLNKQLISCDYAISFGHIETLALKISGCKHIISLLREDVTGYLKANRASALKIIYYKILLFLCVISSEKIIVQCKNDKESLIRQYGKIYKPIEKKITIQINNCNASWMNYKLSKVNSLFKDRIEILFLGYFDYSSIRKGQEVLFPVIARLLDEGYMIRLLVGGDGERRAFYQEKYKDYDQIVFLGRVNNAVQKMKECNFVIVPSLIDSCPNTILEALSAGTTVYGSNTGGIPDILIDSKFMFVPKEDELYCFLKNILLTHRYLYDAQEQVKIKDRLTFDWGGKILEIITQ